MTTVLTPAVPAMTGQPAAGTARRRKDLPALVVLLVSTAALYLWGLAAPGNGNEFYAAAVQSGTKSWKAFLFGSLDQSNFITVDKPPLSLWPMELAGRIFGFNSWTLLAPQALEGVLAVALLYATVRRWFGPAAGLIAGAVLAVTPVAVLMFRFDQPDALMTLLLVAAAYFVTRAIDDGKLRWMLLAGAVMGLNFLTKGLQSFTVLPALALVYLVAANGSLRRRLGHLLAAGAALVAGAAWWVLAVALWPAADRPYIGGSTNNSALDLAFGYNGLGRITGDETGVGGGGGGRGNPTFSGPAGLGRLFNSQMGTQISWLLPASLLAIAALVALAGRAPRTDRIRAAALLWGGWLVVTGLVLSYAGGIIHPYYTVELAPPIAALVGIGSVLLWRQRAHVAARVGLAAGVAVTGLWSFQLLSRSPDWNPWLRPVLLVVALVSAVALLVPPRRLARGALAVGVAGLVVVTGASSAYALNTAATAHGGSTASAGPAATAGSGSGQVGGPGGAGGFGGGTPPSGGTLPSGGTPPSGALPSRGTISNGNTSSSALAADLLKKATTRWAAATVGDQSAASLELASGKAVMAIGGWSGSDPAPTLAQFKAYVAAGDITYYIAGGKGGPGGGNSEIATWVAANYTATTVGGSTVYDLTGS
jgi:4-amino-4-deoxy-L-arabinose transferase-like glycosyltransferase